MNIYDKIKQEFPGRSEKVYKMIKNLLDFIQSTDDNMEAASKIALSDQKEIYRYRNKMAESGYECTPGELEEYTQLIRKLLKLL